MIPIRKPTLGVYTNHRCKRIDLCVILESAIKKYPMEIKKEDFAMVRIIAANLETVKGIMGS